MRLLAAPQFVPGPGQLGHQFEVLRLAARQGRAGLAQGEVPEAYGVHERQGRRNGVLKRGRWRPCPAGFALVPGLTNYADSL